MISAAPITIPLLGQSSRSLSSVVSVVIVSPQLTWPALAGGNSLAIWRWRRLLAADGNPVRANPHDGPSIVVKATARVLLMPVTPSTYGFGAHRHLPCIPTSSHLQPHRRSATTTYSPLHDERFLRGVLHAGRSPNGVLRRQSSRNGTMPPLGLSRGVALPDPAVPLLTRTRSDVAPGHDSKECLQARLGGPFASRTGFAPETRRLANTSCAPTRRPRAPTALAAACIGGPAHDRDELDVGHHTAGEVR